MYIFNRYLHITTNPSVLPVVQVCMLVVVGVASAQQVDTAAPVLDANVDLQSIINGVADGSLGATTTAADPAGTTVATGAALSGGEPTGATQAAAAAGGLANRGTVGLNLGPAFFGQGLNNPNAPRPNQQAVTILQNYLKSAGPGAQNLRVVSVPPPHTHTHDLVVQW